MPHGYECDRCEDFVEQPGEFSVECHTDLHGDSTETVRIANPNLQSDGGPSGGDIEVFTLCEDCRDTVIAVIESGQGVGI